MNTEISDDRSFFGHPKGLAVLFFTEMWERFGYYGMRALLILYCVAPEETGGLGFDAVTAGALYALFAGMVYLLGVPGGWLADRFIGQRKAVLWGGILIAAGYLSMAVHDLSAFYLGLFLVIAGSGLLKPNISTIVGKLYSLEDPRRDSAFSIFYMGINIGAFAAPLICSYLGETISWQLGFGTAGIGMVLGVIIYLIGGRTLKAAGLRPTIPDDPSAARSQVRKALFGAVALIIAGGVVLILQFGGIIEITVKSLSDSFGVILLVITVVLFGWLFIVTRDPIERRRLWAIFALFIAASFFWGAYEQAGSSLNLFAFNDTDRMIGGWEFPAGWFQNWPALLCIFMAPTFAWLWVAMKTRQPTSPVKFSLGLIFVGLGFCVMVGASLLVAQGMKVSPIWLLSTYFLHVVGEMCLSPVGLSTVTKLAPARLTGLMMGVWFLASSVGNYTGGRVAGLYESLPLWQLFGWVAGTTIAAGIILLLFSPLIRRLMSGVH